MSNPDIKTVLSSAQIHDMWTKANSVNDPLFHNFARAIEATVLESTNNAEWLTTAHIICSDAGIAHGHINDRLNALRDHLRDATKLISTIAEKDADAVDAARYRWLRFSGDVETYLHNQPGIDNCKQIGAEYLDAAIDAALQSAGDGDKTA